MKKFISGIIVGAMLFSTTAVIADQISTYKNRFPIEVNGVTKDIEAYNIDGRTYIQLFDVAEHTGLGVQFVDGIVYITTGNNTIAPPTTETNPAPSKEAEATEETIAKGDYSSVPSFEKMSGLKPNVSDTDSKFNRIKYEYDTNLAGKYANQYIGLLKENGFVKTFDVEDDLDFDDDDVDKGDLVFKKGNIYVSIDYDNDDVTIKMATKP